jgi:arylsulfatase A-like enzyme
MDYFMKTNGDLVKGTPRPLSRRGFLGALGRGLPAAALAPEWLRRIEEAAGQVAGAQKPNILLILADDLGYGGLSIQGCPDIPTPNIDSIGKNGARFTNGYVSCPLCAPTRAGLMTGRYQQRFGFEHNPGPAQQAAKNFGLPKSETTLAERLKPLGYVTGMFGKWHLGYAADLQPTRRGFDEFYGFLGGAHPYLPASRQLREGSILRGTESVAEKEYLTDAIAREAVSFIERHKAESFFLYTPFNAVHAPMEAAQKYLDRFKDIKEDLRRTHAAMLAALDDAVGRILGKIREAGLEEKTLIIFLSDNGGPTRQTTSSNAPLRGFKGQALEGGIRIPYMMQWKGHITPGTTDDRPVISLDVHPTAVAAAGAAVDPKWKLDGVNLLPYLTRKKKDRPRETLFWRMGMRQRAVRHGDLKLVWSGSEQPELYDLAKDIGEQRNLAAERPEDLKRLQAIWEAWDKEMMPPQWGGPQAAPARPGQAAKPGANAPANERQLRLRFDAMDRNKDGALAADEVARPRIFRQMDKNSDGKVTLDEMRDFYGIRKK